MAHRKVSHLHTSALSGAIFAGVFLNIVPTRQGVLLSGRLISVRQSSPRHLQKGVGDLEAKTIVAIALALFVVAGAVFLHIRKRKQ